MPHPGDVNKSGASVTTAGNGGSTARQTRSRSKEDKTSASESSFSFPWDGITCKLCSKIPEHNSAALSCKKCRDHYCNQCLDKSVQVYNVLAESTDTMWFCPHCRIAVEKNIHSQIQIEQLCAEILSKYEEKIKLLERLIDTKCTESQVRDIVNSEMQKRTSAERQKEACSTGTSDNTQPVDTDVIEELNDRKRRENNVIVFGIKETNNEEASDRKKGDEAVIKGILDTCNLKYEERVQKVIRLGRYEKINEKVRPLLVSFTSSEDKKKFFKNIRNLNRDEKYKNIRINNDLTKKEREQESALRNEAKLKETNASGKFMFRVRGPPWNRKIVRLAIKKDNNRE